MSKALVVIKNRGIGDLCILTSSLHCVSRKIEKPVTVLAQKNTRAHSIFKHDPHVEEVIELDEKGFFNIIKKIKSRKFDQSYIYSDSIRLFLISKLSGIKENFQYKFFSKKGKIIAQAKTPEKTTTNVIRKFASENKVKKPKKIIANVKKKSVINKKK